MVCQTSRWRSFVWMTMFCSVFGVGAWAEIGTSFSYQGLLEELGSTASGSYDFRLMLYDGPEPQVSTQVGATVYACGVVVEDGLFSIDPDFGEVFDGNEYFLQIEVAPAGTCNGATVWTVLDPLFPVRPAPYALFALAGNEGPQGDQGIQGDQGPPGQQGDQGEPGPPGPSFWNHDGSGKLTYADGSVGVGLSEPDSALAVRSYFTEPTSGQVTVGAGQTQVLGSGTFFTQQLAIDDAILIGGEVSIVSSIDSDTSLFLQAPRSTGALDETAFLGGDLLSLEDGSGRERFGVDSAGNVSALGKVETPAICDPAGGGCLVAAERWVRPCPAGFTAVNGSFCIQTDDHPGADSWWQAADSCRDLGARLCRASEWRSACSASDLEPPLVAMADGAEWVDDATLETGFGVLFMHFTDCGSMWGQFPGTSQQVRCCTSR